LKIHQKLYGGNTNTEIKIGILYIINNVIVIAVRYYVEIPYVDNSINSIFSFCGYYYYYDVESPNAIFYEKSLVTREDYWFLPYCKSIYYELLSQLLFTRGMAVFLIRSVRSQFRFQSFPYALDFGYKATT